VSCCHPYFTATEGGDDAFAADSPRPVAKADLASLFLGAIRYG
jgi:hypothetical protein